MTLRTGTSGFSYREWKPRFYPRDLPASKLLAHYASRLGAVEINNTFYRRPEKATLEAWAASVPREFRFVFKASRYFSAGPGLRDAQKPLAEFFDVLSAVGDRLGPVLVQLPPHVKKDLPLLRDFLAAVPLVGSAAGGTAGSAKRRRVAVDFRDPSWRSDDARDVMRAAGAAWCVTEADDEPLEVVTTAPWAYFRLRKSRYAARDLAAFAERVAGIDDGYVVFKHDDDGRAALHAAQLQKMLNEPSRRSSASPPRR